MYRLYSKVIQLGWIVLCLLCLSSCGQPALQALDSQATILAFGDSLTYGTGVSQSKSYPAALAKLSGRKVINEGLPGELSAAGVKRLGYLLAHYSPDLVIICHGGNDILKREDLAQTRENLMEMVRIAQQHQVQVVLVGVPNISLFSSKAAGFYQEVAEAFEIPIESNIVGKLMLKSKYKSDNVHFNEKGYQLMADAIFDLLKKTGAL